MERKYDTKLSFEPVREKQTELIFGLVREIKLTELRFGLVKENEYVGGEE